MFQLPFYSNFIIKYPYSNLINLKQVRLTNLKQVERLFNINAGINNRLCKQTKSEYIPSKSYPFNKNQVVSSTFNDLNKSSVKESEKDFVIRLKNDPDTFGEVCGPDIMDEGDILEEKHFTEQVSPHKKLRTKQYADIIKNYIRKRQIKEAIDVLEVRMLQEDKVKPEAYIYNLLLGACGRVGYTKKAFMLYNEMKKRGLKVMGGTYTALFNACANSPWPTTDGLTRAKHLYEIMIEKGDQANDTNYNAMVKAFGRCGDLPMAFMLVDEMSQKGFSVKNDTINFLLQACISDKEVGFRHALLVWRKLIEKNIMPSIYTFNLLLRCVRDCGLGDIEITKELIEKLLKVKGKVLAQSQQILYIPGSTNENNVSENVLSENQNSADLQYQFSLSNLRPDLLAVEPHLGNILSLNEVKQPEDRLLLIGGCKGFLQTMSNYKCTPDIKTFTQLLDSIPSTDAAEEELIKAMKKLNVKPDIDFFNMLIKKRSMRCDYEKAKEVLDLIKEIKYKPDLITYGVLALGCKTKEEALDLLNEMKRAGYSMNSAILGAMLHQACYQRSYDYIFEIMELCLRERIPVNKQFLEHLKIFKENCKAKLAAKQFRKREEKLYGIFQARYKTWLTEVQMDESEDVHPWQQYRQTYPENVNTQYKTKDTARFKARHSSLFKVKTQNSIRDRNRKNT